MGTGRTLSVGPLRTTYGLADVYFDGAELRLEVYRRPLALLDRYRLVLAALALLLALSAWYVVGVALLVAAGVLLLVAGVSPRRDGEPHVVAEPDIEEMDHVHGAVRVHLVLHTVDGQLRLTGWWWRRRQLDHLQKRLAA